eukprot:scaffold23417_cov71-Phaeocystis_antarctica.AAC.8
MGWAPSACEAGIACPYRLPPPPTPAHPLQGSWPVRLLVCTRKQQSAPSTAAPHGPRQATSYFFSCCRLHQAYPCVAPHSFCASAHAHGSGARHGSRARRSSKTESRIQPVDTWQVG